MRLPWTKQTATLLACATFVVLCMAFLVALYMALAPMWSPSDTINLSAESTGGASAAYTYTGQRTTSGKNALPDLARLWRIASFTLRQALVSTLISLCLGITAAFLTARRKLPGGGILLSMAAVPLCVPPLLVALGFVMFFGANGVVNRFLMTVLKLPEPPSMFLYSFWGIVIAHGFYNFPLVMKTCHDAWKALPAAEHDAAVLLGAGQFRVFRTITLVQLLPAVASSVMMVFLNCFFSFMIVLLFGGVGTTVIEVEIYQAARSTMDFAQAARLALVETTIAAVVITAYGYLEKGGRENRGMAFNGGGLEPRSLHGWEIPVAILFCTLIFFFFIGPLCSIILSSFMEGGTGYLAAKGFGMASFSRMLSRKTFWRALGNSIVTATTSSALSVIAALFLACAIKTFDSEKRSVAARTIPLFPMAVSSVVLGLGVMQLVHHGTPAVLVLAQAATYWPIAFRQITATMDRIPNNMMDASRTLSPYRLDTSFRILIPMSRRGILSAFGFCFAASCGDTTLPLMLAIPGFDTLALYTYKLAGSYRFNEACACGVVLAMLTVPVFLSGITRRVKKKQHSPWMRK